MVIMNGFLASEMSSGLSESQNYIWNTDSDSDCLGEGTYGKVYLGIHKRTGDKVAVKTFKHVTPQVSQETNMLQTLKHEYIIQLLAIENEEEDKKMVMILELCNGGSLMSFLLEPENTCGLMDGEFLLVFEHLSKGLEYLKRHNVIHRDVKPDNIMRHVQDDGRVIYKLADFGTARELPEGQNFSSLYGTEPYLNPQIYKVCFFRHTEFNNQFGADTDLWSIGVTLYQTATGQLPFMVQDRSVMLRIYEEMRRTEGIISAVQRRNTDEVVYQTKLPNTSRLSFGLKQLIVPLIAGLFIQNSNRQWSFTQYYEEVLEILSRRVIDVFYVNKMQMLKVYVKPEETFNDFKHHVRQQTDVVEDNQVYLHKRNLIVNCFDDFKTAESECVFLFDKNCRDVDFVTNAHLIFENLSDFRQKFMSSTVDHLRLAHVACRDLCVCKNLMDYQSNIYKLFGDFVTDFYDFCKDEEKELHKEFDILIEKQTSLVSRVDILLKLQGLSQSTNQDSLDSFRAKTNVFIDETSTIFEDVTSNKRKIIANTSHDSYLKIVVKELSDMKSILRKMVVSNVNRKYECEKIKIVHCVRTIMEILTHKTVPSFDEFINVAKDWYKNVFFSHIRALSSLKKHINRYRDNLRKFETEIDAQSKENLEKIANGNKATVNKEKILELLETYKQNSVGMKVVLDENVSLLEKMTKFVMNLDTDF